MYVRNAMIRHPRPVRIQKGCHTRLAFELFRPQPSEKGGGKPQWRSIKKKKKATRRKLIGPTRARARNRNERVVSVAETLT